MSKQILVVDDHEVVRQGVRLILRARPEWRVIDEAENGMEAIEKTKALSPDLVILDISMPGKDGIEVIKELTNMGTKSKILVLTMHHSGELLTRLKLSGASGYVVKTCASRDLIRAMEETFNGGTFFPQQSSPLNNGHKPSGKSHISSLSSLASDQIPFRIDGISFPESGLTIREVDVLREMARGKRSAEIAASYEISIRTVEAHRANIMRKLNLHSSTDLIHFAIHNHILDA